MVTKEEQLPYDRPTLSKAPGTPAEKMTLRDEAFFKVRRRKEKRREEKRREKKRKKEYERVMDAGNICLVTSSFVIFTCLSTRFFSYFFFVRLTTLRCIVVAL